MIRDGQVDLQHSHDRANQPFALAQRQSKHRSQCQSRLNGEIGIARLAARRGSGLRLPTSQRFVGEPNREASTIAKRRVIVTPVRHSMPLTWNVASALGMEFERHDRTSRWQRRSSVAKLLKRPPRPYPCTKVAEGGRGGTGCLTQAGERRVPRACGDAGAAEGDGTRIYGNTLV